MAVGHDEPNRDRDAAGGEGVMTASLASENWRNKLVRKVEASKELTSPATVSCIVTTDMYRDPGLVGGGEGGGGEGGGGDGGGNGGGDGGG